MEISSEKVLREIDSLKTGFKKKRIEIKNRFLKNNLGIKNCVENSDLIDSFIDQLYEKIKFLNKKIENNFLVCAVGGYGRKQLAPYSDLDLLFVYDDLHDLKEIEKLVQLILFPVWDLKFKVGYAVRTIKEIMEFSKKDHVIRTSMLDARLISGSPKLFKKIMSEFFEGVSKTGRSFLKEKIKERKEKIIEISYDYFRNEPNIKESEGSLRDLNLIFWGLKIFQISSKNATKKIEQFLTPNEKKKLKSSLEFLLTIRCHLHYFSKRSNDKLSFDFQRLISDKINKKKMKGTLNSKVELMMKNYFFQTKNTKNLVQVLSQILDERLKKKTFISDVKKNDENLLEKFLANLARDKKEFFQHRVVLDRINKIPKKHFFSKKNISNFKKIFFSEKKEKFMLLYDLGVLSKIIPDFSSIEYLTQFDRYHSLTVGQHTLRALNILKDIRKNITKKKHYEFAKKIFRTNFKIKPLFYAVLLHDIGKGLGGEHHLKGAKAAQKIVLQLYENKKIAEETSWLIENHLLLSEFAFKKDLEDGSVIKGLATQIPTINKLRSLFLLTVADISAVDHGLWNQWKASLLQDLYLKTEKEILNPEDTISLNKKIQKIKNNVIDLSKSLTKKSLDSFSKITYPNYWLLQHPKMIVFQIENFFDGAKKKNNFDFFIKKLNVTKLLEITVVTNDKAHLFIDLISIFISENISVHQARIFTLDDNTVIDTFTVSHNVDYFLTKEEENEKIRSLEKKLKLFKDGKFVNAKMQKKINQKIIKKKVDIQVDNNSSSTYTVLVVNTNDRPGLLYDISKILIKNKLVISMAKISTDGDFVEDSFHLRNEFGFKINNEVVTENLKNEIKKSLEKELENAF